MVSDLQIPNIHEDVSNITSNHDLVLAAINMFQNHRSVVNINHRDLTLLFHCTKNEVRKIMKNLNVRKTCQSCDIQAKIIKLNINLFSSFICHHFNYCIGKEEFTNELKHADVIPVYKKKINVIKLFINQ